jgi:hypothetical protein
MLARSAVGKYHVSGEAAKRAHQGRGMIETVLHILAKDPGENAKAKSK